MKIIPKKLFFQIRKKSKRRKKRITCTSTHTMGCLYNDTMKNELPIRLQRVV